MPRRTKITQQQQPKVNLSIAHQYADAARAGQLGPCPWCEQRGASSQPIGIEPHKHRDNVGVVKFDSCGHSVNVVQPTPQ